MSHQAMTLDSPLESQLKCVKERKGRKETGCNEVVLVFLLLLFWVFS